MKKIALILPLFLLLSFVGFSQNMQKGFTFLETGKYTEAETFFKTILKDHPTNKTANLCYGRAVGLNGNAPKAIEVFTSLLKKFPNDFEIKLNYAEALLWSKNFTDAEVYYEKLILENDQSFPALLGFANTLSNLKKYNKALEYVNLALVVLPGNQNALVSKKYIQLGFADQSTKKQDYGNAIYLLKNNLTLFKGDKETLKNLVNTYIIAKDFKNAKATYKTLATTKKDSIVALNGLALIAHLEEDNKNAFAISQSAVAKAKKINDTLIENQTTERYIQTLIWNKKFKKAKKHISKLILEKPNQNWVLALRATLNTYTGDFDSTLDDYSKILENKKSSFDGNLGKANALRASGRFSEAYEAAEKTLTFYKGQKDAVNFIKDIDKQFTPFAESKTAYSFDNGENKTVFTQLNIEFPLTTKFKLRGSYGHRTTENKITKNNASANSVLFGVSHRWFPKVVFNAVIGFSAAKTKTINEPNPLPVQKEYNQFLTNIYFNLKPLKLQTLDIGYMREIESFNADLLEKEIIKNNFYANYNVGTNYNLGWFTQYFYTSQSDGNARNLLFTSLYYNILSKPILKTGLNFQAISFKEKSLNYFSPEKFRAYEVFINFLKDENAAKIKALFYNIDAATGFQFIEDDAKQTTYRIQAKLGYKFSGRCLANFYGTRSNIASANAATKTAGFTYNEIGFRIKWVFLKGPVYSRD